MSAEGDRVETASPALPEDEAKEPDEMSNSQVASASPGIVTCTCIIESTGHAENQRNTFFDNDQQEMSFNYRWKPLEK